MFQGMDSSGQQRMAARDTRSSARRRRERRLRAQWRHEQQIVSMALAVATHHSAQRGEWRDLKEAPRRPRTASAEATNVSSKERVAWDAVYFELFDEDTAGLRPEPVLDPRPQERVLQRTVEHEDVICHFVQILDAPVPQLGEQLGEQLVHFFSSLDTQLPVDQDLR